MSLLAVILVMFSIIKLVIAHAVSKSEIYNVSVTLPIDPEAFRKGITNFLILDGLVGLFCGIYLLL